MQRGYLASNQTDSLFQIQQSENPLNASVAENLSGTAQQLKSADNAVAYKNLNGGNIEDTTMVQDAHTQTLQTDWTDNYDTGVTSTVTETAPSINQSINVAQSHSTTISNLNESFTTAQDNRTLNVTNYDAYYNSLQTSIPTNSQSTIAQTGTSTTNSLQSQIGTQNLNTSALNQNFNSLTQNGNTALGGTSNINGANINIGPGGDTSSLMPTSGWSMHVPPIQFTVISDTINLPPIYKGTTCYQITLTISGNARGNNPSFTGANVSASNEDIELNFQKAISDYFAQINVINITGEGVSAAPNITIGVQGKNYSFADGVQVQVMTPNVQVYQYTNEQEVDADSEGWEFSLDATFALTVTVSSKNNFDAANSVYSRMITYLRQENAKIITTTKYGKYLYMFEEDENQEYVFYESRPFLVRVLINPFEK